MIVDANIIIALLDDQDAQHSVAANLIANTDSDLLVHEITLAETLVHPYRAGAGALALHLIENLGIRTAESLPGFALYLAEVRAETGLKMPDCIGLALAMKLQHDLATFDNRLRNAATRLGLRVRPD